MRRCLLPELANGPHVDALVEALGLTAELSFEQSLDEIAAKPRFRPPPDAREGVAAFRDKRAAAFNAWLGSSQEK
jgi:hypothetical protein